jgi:opacity protein-like surface antigen/cell division septation protein DedD
MIKVDKFFATLAFVTIASSLQAIQFEVTPTVSKAFNADKDSLKDDEVLYGVRGNLYFNKEVALQLGLEASTENEMSDKGKTDIERGLINIVYEKDLGNRFKPYTIVGGGYERVHRESDPKTNDDSQAFINLGVGLKYDITKRINLMTEARWLKKLENNDEDIIATVGLGMKIGSIKNNRHIPSVTETTPAQNAISLAKFKELQKKGSFNKKPVIKKPVITKVVKSAVTETTQTDRVIVEENIPADAIVLGENESIDDIVETDNVSSEDTIVENLPAASDSGYYIQLAALFKGKGETITSRLESKNYHYMRKDVQRFGKNATLILVGPYNDRVEANIAMKYLKRLKSDAFIHYIN